MKFSFLLPLFPLALAAFGGPASPSKSTKSTEKAVSGDLVFRLDGMEKHTGWARVVLYDRSEKYLSQFGFAAADSARVQSDGSCEITLRGLPFGQYAGTFYQDENWNHVIDRNLIGVPTEPYAFSNGVRAKWTVPGFKTVSFDFRNSGQKQNVTLRRWVDQ